MRRRAVLSTVASLALATPMLVAGGSAVAAPRDRGPAAGQWFVEQAAELLALAVPPVERPTCEVAYTVHGTWQGKKGSGFIARVELRNTGAAPLDGRELRWTPDGDQRLTDVRGARATSSELSHGVRSDPGRRDHRHWGRETPAVPGQTPVGWG